MDLIVKFLFLSGKYITCAAGKTILEIINHSVKIQRHVTRKYDHVTQMVGPYDNMLELMNARIEENSVGDIASPEASFGGPAFDVGLEDALSEDSASLPPVPPVHRKDTEYERIFQDLYEDLHKSSTELKTEMMNQKMSRCEKTFEKDAPTKQLTTMQPRYVKQHFYGTCTNDCSIGNVGGLVPLCDRYSHMNSLMDEAPDDSYFKKHAFAVREKKSINVHSSAGIYNFKKALLAHEDSIDLCGKDFITDLKAEIQYRTFSTQMECGKYHELQSKLNRLTSSDSCSTCSCNVSSCSKKCCKRQFSWQAFESNLERKLQRKIFRIINRHMSNNSSPFGGDNEVEKQNRLQADLMRVNEVAFSKLEQKVTQILIQQSLRDIEEVFSKKEHLRTIFPEVKRLNFDEMCSNTSARIQNAVIKGLREKKAQMMPTGIGDITELIEEQIRPAIFETRHGDFVSKLEDVLRLREATPFTNIIVPFDEQRETKKIDNETTLSENPMHHYHRKSKSDRHPISIDVNMPSEECNYEMVEMMTTKPTEFNTSKQSEVTKTNLTESDMKDIQQRTDILESNWRAFKIFEEYLQNVMIFDKDESTKNAIVEKKPNNLFQAFSIDAIYNSLFSRKQDTKTGLNVDEINMKFISEGKRNSIKKMPPLVHPDVVVIPAETLLAAKDTAHKESSKLVAIKEDIAIETEKMSSHRKKPVSYMEILSERERQHLEAVAKSVETNEKKSLALTTADAIKQPSASKSIQSDFIVEESARHDVSSKKAEGCVSDFIVNCGEKALSNEISVESERKEKKTEDVAEKKVRSDFVVTDPVDQATQTSLALSSKKPKDTFSWLKDVNDREMEEEEMYNAECYPGNEGLLNEIDIEDTNDAIESLNQELYNQEDSVEPSIADLVTRLWDKPTDYLTLDPMDPNVLLFPEPEMYSPFFDVQRHKDNHEVFYDKSAEAHRQNYEVPHAKILNLEKELKELKTQIKSLSTSSIIAKAGLDVVSDGNICEYVLNTPKQKQVAEIKKGFSDTNIAISAGKPKKIHLNIYLPKTLMQPSKSNPQLIQRAGVKQISNLANSSAESSIGKMLSIDPDRLQRLQKSLQLKTVDIERLCRVHETLTPSPIRQQHKTNPKSIDMDRLLRVHENLASPKAHVHKIDVDKLLNLQRNLKEVNKISLKPIFAKQIDCSKTDDLRTTLKSPPPPPKPFKKPEVVDEGTWKPRPLTQKFKFNLAPSYNTFEKPKAEDKKDKQCKELKIDEGIKEFKAVKDAIRIKEDKALKANKDDIIIRNNAIKEFKVIKEKIEIKEDEETVESKPIAKSKEIDEFRNVKEYKPIKYLKTIKKTAGIKDLIGNDVQKVSSSKIQDSPEQILSTVKVIDLPKPEVNLDLQSSKAIEENIAEAPDEYLSTVQVEVPKDLSEISKVDAKIQLDELKVAVEAMKSIAKPLKLDEETDSPAKADKLNLYLHSDDGYDKNPEDTENSCKEFKVSNLSVTFETTGGGEQVNIPNELKKLNSKKQISLEKQGREDDLQKMEQITDNNKVSHANFKSITKQDTVKEELKDVSSSSKNVDNSTDFLRVRYNEDKEIAHVEFREGSKSNIFLEKIFNNSNALMNKFTPRNIDKQDVEEVERKNEVEASYSIKVNTTVNSANANESCGTKFRNIFPFIPSVRDYGEDEGETPCFLGKMDTKNSYAPLDCDAKKDNVVSFSSANAVPKKPKSPQSNQQSRKICGCHNKDDVDNDIDYIIDKNSAKSKENRKKIFVKQDDVEDEGNVKDPKQMAQAAESADFTAENNEGEEECKRHVFGRKSRQRRKEMQRRPEKVLQQKVLPVKPTTIETPNVAKKVLELSDNSSQNPDQNVVPVDQPKQNLDLMKLSVDIQDNARKHSPQNPELLSPNQENLENLNVNIVLDKIDDTDYTSVEQKGNEGQKVEEPKPTFTISLIPTNEGFSGEANNESPMSEFYAKSEYTESEKLAHHGKGGSSSDFFRFGGPPSQQPPGSSDGGDGNFKKKPKFIMGEVLREKDNKHDKPKLPGQNTRSAFRNASKYNAKVMEGNDEGRRKKVELSTPAPAPSKKPPVFQFRPEKVDFRPPETEQSEDFYVKPSRKTTSASPDEIPREDKFKSEYSADARSPRDSSSREISSPRDVTSSRDAASSREMGSPRDMTSPRDMASSRDAGCPKDSAAGSSRDAELSKNFRCSRDLVAPAKGAMHIDLVQPKESPRRKEFTPPTHATRETQASKESQQTSIEAQTPSEAFGREGQKEIQLSSEFQVQKGEGSQELQVPKQFNQPKENGTDLSVKFDVHEPFPKKVSFEYKPFNPTHYLNQQQDKMTPQIKTQEKTKADATKSLGNNCKLLVRSDAEIGSKSTERLEEEFDDYEAKFVALGSAEAKSSVEITKQDNVKYESTLSPRENKLASKSPEYKPTQQSAGYSTTKPRLEENSGEAGAVKVNDLEGFQKSSAPKKMEQLYLRRPSRSLKHPDEKPPQFQQQQQQHKSEYEHRYQHRAMIKNPPPLKSASYKTTEKPNKPSYAETKKIDETSNQQIKETEINNMQQQLVQQHFQSQQVSKKAPDLVPERRSEKQQQPNQGKPMMAKIETKKNEPSETSSERVKVAEFRPESVEQNDVNTKDLQNVLQKVPAQQNYDQKGVVQQQKAQELDAKSLGDKVQQQLESLDKMVKDLPKQALQIIGKKIKEQNTVILSQDQLQTVPQLPSQPSVKPLLQVKVGKQADNLTFSSSKEQLQGQPQLPSQSEQEATGKQSKVTKSQEKENQGNVDLNLVQKSFEFKPLRETQQYYKEEVVHTADGKPKNTGIIKSYEFNYMEPAPAHKQEKANEPRKAVKKKPAQSCDVNVKVQEKRVERNEKKRINAEKKSEVKEKIDARKSVNKEETVNRKPEITTKQRLPRPISKIYEHLVLKRADDVRRSMEIRTSEEARGSKDVRRSKDATRSEDVRRSLDATRSEVVRRSDDARGSEVARGREEKKAVSTPSLNNYEKQQEQPSSQEDLVYQRQRQLSKRSARSRSKQRPSQMKSSLHARVKQDQMRKDQNERAGKLIKAATSADLRTPSPNQIKIKPPESKRGSQPAAKVTKQRTEERDTRQEYLDTEEDLMKPRVKEEVKEEELDETKPNDPHKIDRSVLTETSWLQERGTYLKHQPVQKTAPPTEKPVESPTKNYFPKKSYDPVDLTLSIAETIKRKEMQAKARAGIEKARSAPYVFEYRQPIQYNSSPERVRQINCDHLGIVWPKPKMEEKATIERVEKSRIFTTPPTLEMSTSAVLDRQVDHKVLESLQDEVPATKKPGKVVYSFDDKYRKATSDREIHQKKIDYWKTLQREDKWAPIPTELTIANEVYGSKVLMRKQEKKPEKSKYKDRATMFKSEFSPNAPAMPKDPEVRKSKRVLEQERRESEKRLKREQEEEDKIKYGNISPLLRHYLKQKGDRTATVPPLYTGNFAGPLTVHTDQPAEDIPKVHRMRDEKKSAIINVPTEGSIYDKYPLLRKDRKGIDKKKQEEEELADRQAEYRELMRVEQQKKEAERFSAQAAALMAEERSKAIERDRGPPTFANQTAVKFNNEPYCNKLTNMMKWKMRYNAHIERLNTTAGRRFEENKLVKKFPFLRKYRKASEQIHWPDQLPTTDWDQFAQLPYNPAAAGLRGTKGQMDEDVPAPTSSTETHAPGTSSGPKSYVFQEKELKTKLGRVVKVTYLVQDAEK